MERIGVVLGSREATPLEFWVGVEGGGLLRLDDLVVVEGHHPKVGRVRYFGMVDRVAKVHEGESFDTDTFLAVEGKIPVSLAYVAHVSVTRILPEEFFPPDPGSPVYLAQGEELELALYYEAMRNQRGSTKLPAGLLKNGEVAYLNLEFLNGAKGGHVNISGISGVAAKTSYATFLLKSLLESGVLEEAHQAKVLLFNVKGEDLFFLDKKNARLTEEARAAYARLGLPATPFGSVAFLAPPKKEGYLPDVDTRLEGVRAYHWDLVQFAQRGLLPFLFADKGALSNLGFLVAHVAEKLRRLAQGQKGPALLVEDWPGEDLPEGITFDALGKVRLKGFAELVAYLEFKLLGPESGEGEGDRAWTARQARPTLEAFVRRLRASVEGVGHLLRGDRPGNPPDPLKGEQVHVVDLAKLRPQAQMFVVGALLKDLFERKERGQYRGQVFVVLDELNKYAPRDEESPIKDVLLDIAERGRSLGVILIGAQQTASEVERRVVGNAAIRVVGRLDAAEAERPEYRHLPASFRQRALILPQGAVILSQPEIPVPLLVRFPFPAWATKREEVLEDNSAEALRRELF
ncbi:ATP-binding protein [Thermus thermamylovorans]|uniref:ATP-binding protein n=1 Tax=Thermus thermamylovorans TaxID=2509362 RepID=A0A4Q9B884_9DEIN|nr:ATP-binding protein [Thermus thermamylovorans]TBH21413.1 ATP-binding protein [Thermus thermamylovorans]